ncbi:homoserine kinase [Candidatus Woesearchaeota archaeon]|jgi:homoserine kinase type II|nr:homoserine kinase [Candidatus Woesearchaeota archaeon]MBT5342302.1 homoserine kinase [Candidatus Woesearchaeota archaeon]
MIAKTKFSKEELNKIISGYNLGQLKSFRPFETGAVQTNILLKTSKGKFVLRYYGQRTKKYVLFEVNILHYFRDHKYPCATPIRNIHGDFIGKYNGKYFAIFNYLEGKHIKKPNNIQYHQLGKYLAKLHNLSQGYKPDHWEVRENKDKKFCLDTAKVESKKFKSKTEAKEKLKFLKREISKVKLPGSLPKGVCHGDWDITNLKFEGNKLTGVLDFDDSCYTHLIFDVANFIYYWAWMREKEFNFSKARSLLRDYFKYRKLSEVEKKYLFDGIKMVIFTYMGWFFYEKWKTEDVFDNCKKRLEFLDSIGRDEFYNRLFK